MNTDTHRFVTPLALMILVLGATWVSADDDLDDLRRRFKQRYPQLLALKEAGKIGETWSGYVEAVKPEYRQETSKLVNEENDDRRSLYRLLAKEEGLSTEEVAKNNAVRNFRKAGEGEFLKGPDGKWKQKS